MSISNIVQKLWNYCSILRDDGLLYGDYLEQLTYSWPLKISLGVPGSIPESLELVPRPRQVSG